MRAIRILLMTGFVALLAVGFADTAAAATAWEFHDGMWVLSLTPDGKVVCGSSMNGAYEAVRWTAETGNVPLGLSSGLLLGQGGGYSRMSDDGNRVCSSSVNADTTLCSPGLWTKGSGWQVLFPPLPANGAPGGIDGHLGEPYDVSGDGSTVVGLYWLSTGRGQAFKWSAATGPVSLGGQGGLLTVSSRANVTNYDGSVVGGWSSSPTTQMWQPTIWQNGNLIVLNATEVGCQVMALNRAGDIAAGQLYNPANRIREPAIWVRTNGVWNAGQRLGILPDSMPIDTQALANGITDDGSVLVGEYLYDISYRTGFVWTLDQGLMTADEYFATVGVAIPAGFVITGLSVITPDGNRIGGYGYDTTLPNNPFRGFVVTLDTTSDAPVPVAAGGVRLGRPTPNPFNPVTNLALGLARDGQVRLAVYDVRGAEVRVLVDGPLAAGDHVFTWDGRDDQGRAMPSGLYLARARTTAGGSDVQRLVLAR